MKPRHVTLALAVALTACCATPKKVVHPKFGMFSGPTTTGTVTSVAAGTGLTGGTIVHSGTIAADTTYLQKRVTGTCASGNAVGTINADGTVTCNSAGGSGLSGLTTGDLLNAASATTAGNYAGSTATSCLAGNAVTGAAMSATGTLTTTCTAVGSVTGTGTSGKGTRWTSSSGIGNASFGDDGTTLTAAELAGTEQDYATSGTTTDVALNSGITVLRYAAGTDASATFDGMSGGGADRFVLLVNASTTTGHTITLKNENTGDATAADRFDLPNSYDFVVPQGRTVLLGYDATSSRWRVASGGDGGSCSAGQHIAQITPDGTISCSADSPGSGTSGDLTTWATASTLGSFGGSSPSACSAGTAMTDLALSAAGVLTLTCTQQLTGAGAGTTGDLMAWSSASAAGNYAGSSPSACTSGSVMTDAALSAAGVMSVTCGVTPLTATNVSGTANDLAKFTGTNTVGNSNLSDDGTTAVLGTTNAEVKEATGELDLNSAATPDHSQLQIRANSAGGFGIKDYSTDNVNLQFDELTIGGVNTAEYTSVGSITKTGGQLKIYGGTSQTIGSAVSVGERWHVDLGTGAMESFGSSQLGSSTSNAETLEGTTEVVGAFSVYNNGTIPTISGCGTGATISSQSSNNGGTITLGTTPGTCAVTFSTATGYGFTNAPACTVTAGSSAMKGGLYISVSSTVLTINGTSLGASGDDVFYTCIGEKN